ncbi:MAG: BadM/Rrf2 family transcriptional regulator [Parvularcula sp.]|nr:BadM/Rrf2 family transcriptional regulator [Parvularcula sp.]
MRLTVQTDYALRMLMHLAVNADRLSTISEIAGRYDISKNHLMKVAQTLSSWNIIDSVRGRAGGLRLARKPGDISLGSIARPLEAGSALVECFPGGAGACRITSACKLKGVLAEAQEAFFTVLDTYSLEDLVRRNPGLRDLLMEAA